MGFFKGMFSRMSSAIRSGLGRANAAMAESLDLPPVDAPVRQLESDLDKATARLQRIYMDMDRMERKLYDSLRAGGMPAKEARSRAATMMGGGFDDNRTNETLDSRRTPSIREEARSNHVARPRSAKGDDDFGTEDMSRDRDGPKKNKKRGIGALSGADAKTRGGWKGSFGGSGIKGITASYEVRSGVQLATNPLSRLRLTGAGYLALVLSASANDEMRHVKDEMAKRGDNRAFAQMSDKEVGRLIGNSNDGIGGRVIRGASKGLISTVGSFWSGLVSATAVASGFFGASDKTVGAIAKVGEQLSTSADAMAGAISEGFGAALVASQRALTDLRIYGGPEGKIAFEEGVERAIAGRSEAVRFFRDLGNDISRVVMDVTGIEAKDQLLKQNQPAISELVTYRQEQGKNGSLKALTPFLGTKE